MDGMASASNGYRLSDDRKYRVGNRSGRHAALSRLLSTNSQSTRSLTIRSRSVGLSALRRSNDPDVRFLRHWFAGVRLQRLCANKSICDPDVVSAVARPAGRPVTVASPAAFSRWPFLRPGFITPRYRSNASSTLSPGPNPSITHGRFAARFRNSSRMNKTVGDDMFPHR